MTEDSLIIPRCIKNSLVSLNPTTNKNANPKQWTKEERCAGVAAWTAALCSRSAANYSAALAHRIRAAETRLRPHSGKVTTAAVGPPSPLPEMAMHRRRSARRHVALAALRTVAAAPLREARKERDRGARRHGGVRTSYGGGGRRGGARSTAGDGTVSRCRDIPLTAYR